MQPDEWDLQLLLLTGVLAIGLIFGGVRAEAHRTTGWPSPALIHPREEPAPEPSARPGTAGWTPPAQLQRAVRPEETEEALPRSDWPPPDRER